MDDQHTPLASLRDALRAFNHARDWDQFHCPRNLAMALCVEAAEVLELFLWSRDDGPQPPLASRAERLPDELADVLICLLNLCNHTNIDLAAAFERKLAHTALRYPIAQARGSMRKYNELDDAPAHDDAPVADKSTPDHDPPG